MTNRSASEGQRDRRSAGGRLLPWMAVLGLIWGVVLVGMWSAEAAAAEAGPVVLQGVDISPLAGNRLQLRFRMSGPPKGPPSSFTINQPARIVLDFLETTNGLSARQQSINVGVADKISVLEGADRTRASLNLARLVPYNVQVQGNAVVLTLENAGAGPTRTPAPTPTAAVKAAAASSRQVADATGPVTTPRRVSEVGFKRGPGGQGVITTKLSHPNIAVDVRQEGNQIIADFQGAALPRGQERRLDVTDFATPVATVDALNRGGNARLSIKPNPPFEYLAYQANDLYVIEVRPPQKSKEEEEKEAMFDPSKKKYTGDLLSLNFQDIEVRAILQILADFTGKNIVVSDSVKGNLTLRLQNVPWDQALDIILRTKGLTMRENGNVIFIAPTEEVAAREKLDLESRRTVQELIPLRTEIMQVNYAKAKDVAELLKRKAASDKGVVESGILSPRGDVSVDERTNSLIVKDVPDKIAEVRELVTKLDVPAKQVMIDSRIVIANDDFARDIGVRFGVTGVTENGNEGVSTVSGTLAGTSTIVDSAVENLTTTGQPFPVTVPALAQRLGVNLAAAGGSSIAFAILGADYLVDLELSALQTEGKGEILSNPRVVTADLKKATILQGRQIPYPTTSDEGTKIEWKDAFLKLEVTPQITPDDRVRMDLKVSKDEQGTQVIVNGVSSASIDKREVETQVLVNNGETVVLGGVFEQTKSKNQTKVPLLGDIPLLGYLFQENRKVYHQARTADLRDAADPEERRGGRALSVQKKHVIAGSKVMRRLLDGLQGFFGLFLLATMLVGWSGVSESGGFIGPNSTVTVEISADKTTLPINILNIGPSIGGPYTNTVNVTVKQNGKLLATPINVAVAAGLSSGALYYLDGDPEHEQCPTGATCPPTATVPIAFRQLAFEDATGIATFHFNASSAPGTVVLTASAQDPNSGKVISGSLTIEVVGEQQRHRRHARGSQVRHGYRAGLYPRQSARHDHRNPEHDQAVPDLCAG